MRSVKDYPGKGALVLGSMVLALLALSLPGCTAPTRGIQVLAVGNQDVLDLTARDVVQIMRAAGFTDEHIRQHGRAVRDGMATRGAVQVKINDTVEAVFAAKGDMIYVSTRSRGHFYYDVKTGWPQRPYQ